MVRRNILILALACLFPLLAFTQYIENEPQIGIYEHLDDYIPEDLVFVDERGDTIQFVSLINKPTVLVLVYYTCPGICSPLLDGVADVIGKMDLELGKDYEVITVSFNEAETWQLARDKKKNYTQQVKRAVDTTAWHWLTGDSINIARLTNSVGFKYIREGVDFIHAATIIAISPKGKITRYLYGTYFLPFDLKMALAEANRGQSGPTINKVLRYCFSYDPEGKKYVFNITKVTATIVLFFAFSFLLYLILSRRKRAGKQTS